MIVRVVLLIAVILAVLYLVDAYHRLLQSSGRGELGGRARPSRPADGQLVGCASCGVHVPAARALWVEVRGRRTAFCSPACRRAGAAR